MEKLAEALHEQFREALTAYSSEDVRAQLSSALRGDGGLDCCYVCAVYGDDDSGEVVYSDGGCYYKAGYSMGTTGGKRTVSIDTEGAVKVLPHMTYDVADTDEDESMAAMESSTKRALGLFERFVSKGERDKMSKSDFAGKGTSFPINKPADVMAAVRSLGRAGAGNYSSDTIKANIKKIAKRKGFALPKSMQDDKSEGAREIELTGDLVPLREGAVGQDGTAYLKLIAPGWGSSGYYSREVLRRDGPTIFKAGTKNFWNHPTAAEESARPEGDLRDLASVLSEDAHYDENGQAGPGLYARATVTPHFREHVDALAKHIGMSIRAVGSAKEGSAEGKKGPIIERLTRAQSVDYVTTPGAGGKILQLFEAARASQPIPVEESGDDMDEATVQRLIESGVQKALAPLQAENRKLLERLAVVTEAPRLLQEALGKVNLPAASQKRVASRCNAELPIKEGKLDEAAFAKIIEREIKDEGDFLKELSGGRYVVGMGAAPTDPKALKEARESEAEAYEEALNDLADSMVLRQPGAPDDKDARKARRKNFREGRAA